jgi:hypothetical protein
MFDVATIPMAQFSLRWRFTNPQYNALPARDLQRIQPLDASSAGRLLELTRPWYREQPFTQGWFADVISIPTNDIDPEAVRRVRKWLFQRGIPFSHRVFLSWSSTEAAVTTWKMVVRYWDDLWYPASDDLVVFDSSLSWALFFWHEEEAFFASRPIPHGPAT